MNEQIKQQYQYLYELKKLDEKIIRLQEDLEKIPLEVRQIESELEQSKQVFENLRTHYELQEKLLRKGELELKELEDRFKKAQEKMMEVKTNEEYQAALKESGTQREEKSRIEDRVLNLLTEVENEKQHMKDAEKTFLGKEVLAKKNLHILSDERSKLLGILEEDNVKKGQYFSQLDETVREIFKRVSLHIKGSVSFVENGMCMSCHMKVRPQLYNEVLGYRAIHRCPSCSRILITPPDENEDEKRAAQP